MLLMRLVSLSLASTPPVVPVTGEEEAAERPTKATRPVPGTWAQRRRPGWGGRTARLDRAKCAGERGAQGLARPVALAGGAAGCSRPRA